MAASRKWLFLTFAGGVLAIASVLAAAYVIAPSPKGPPAPALPALQADPQQLTIAGNSSGGFMAIQAAVAHSATFHGLAVLGAAPYYCTEGRFFTALRCMGYSDDPIPTGELIAKARLWASEGRIDPLTHLTSQKTYVFRGTLDTIIPQYVAQAVVDFHRSFGAPVTTNFTVPVAHGWVSPYGTNSCLNETDNLINNCKGVDAAQEFLSLFYGKLNAKNDGKLSGRLIEFDQNEFFDDKSADAHSASEFGFAYIPAACEKGGCRAVIALHGCEQDHGKIGRKFVDQSGINQWADTNRIVVVYPQVKASNLGGNPRGCWDMAAYDSEDFAWKSGPQIKLLKRIAERIAAPRSVTAG